MIQVLRAEAELRGPETWIAPLSLEEFLRSHWGRAPLLISGSEARVESLRDELGLRLDSLPPNASGIALAKLARGPTLETVSVTMGEAEKLRAFGSTVNVKQPLCALPLARAFADVVRAPPDCVESSVYFSRAGGFTPMHFDASEVLVIQIYGSKTWKVAPVDVSAPLEHAGLGCEAPPLLRMHHHAEWPSAEPPGTVEFEAGAGSVVFVPRGGWHATRTAEESLSLHFQYRSVTWVEAFASLVTRELSRLDGWRDGVILPAGDETRDALTRGKLERLLRDAVDTLGHLDADDLFGRDVSATEPRRFRRRAGIGLGIEAATDDEGHKLVRAIPSRLDGERAVYCSVSPELVPVVEWIASRPLAERFVAADVPRGEASTLEDIEELCATLQEAGVIASA